MILLYKSYFVSRAFCFIEYEKKNGKKSALVAILFIMCSVVTQFDVKCCIVHLKIYFKKRCSKNYRFCDY